MVLADFGHDPRSSKSWRTRQNFVFLSGEQPRILPTSRQPNFTKFEHNASIGVAMNLIGRKERKGWGWETGQEERENEAEEITGKWCGKEIERAGKQAGQAG